jgi:hypothetical protein
MEHRPEDYSICVVNATGRRENLDQRARVASAARAASFKRPSILRSILAQWCGRSGIPETLLCYGGGGGQEMLDDALRRRIDLDL